jgi:hypothetical protein
VVEVDGADVVVVDARVVVVVAGALVVVVVPGASDVVVVVVVSSAPSPEHAARRAVIVTAIRSRLIAWIQPPVTPNSGRQTSLSEVWNPGFADGADPLTFPSPITYDRRVNVRTIHG